MSLMMSRNLPSTCESTIIKMSISEYASPSPLARDPKRTISHPGSFFPSLNFNSSRAFFSFSFNDSSMILFDTIALSPVVNDDRILDRSPEHHRSIKGPPKLSGMVFYRFPSVSEGFNPLANRRMEKQLYFKSYRLQILFYFI